MIKMQDFTMDKPPFCVSERLSAKKNMTTVVRSIYILPLDSHIGSLKLHKEFRGVLIASLYTDSVGCPINKSVKNKMLIFSRHQYL